MTVTIQSLQERDARDWNEFVERSEDATFFHRAEWKSVLESALRHATHYLLAREDGQITGVLPLAEIRSRLFGHHLVSTPFCVYGGVCATTEAARNALTAHACRLAEDLGVQDLELRNTRVRQPEWPRKDLYATFRKSIKADREENLKAIPRKQRAMVRKGIQAGLEGHETDDVDRLYSIYSESVRNLGTPVFHRRYFQALAEAFPEQCQLLIVRQGSRDIAGVMSFRFRQEVLPYYGGSLPVAREVKGNDFMYWDLMCRAAEDGATLFDFGRSKIGTGHYSFKKNWGFEPTVLSYEYYLVGTKDVPRLDPANPKYQPLISIWKRLPLPVANTLGPLLARNLG